MRIIIAAILGIGAVVIVCSNAKADKTQAESTMAESAQQAYEASASMYEVSAGGVTLEAVYTWSKRWAEAEGDGTPPNVRHQAFLAHSERMKLLHSKVAAKYDIAVAGGEKDKYWATVYYKAEADQMVKKDAAAAKP